MHDATADDIRFMRLALALGQRHIGMTWPNPSVGAVVVGEGGAILAQGVTQQGGRPHAERMALDEIGKAARGATLYVTLEPCSHHGRTSPCAEAILLAGIKRVVSGVEDPDIRVSGRGHGLLREAGVEVVSGLLEAEAKRSHAGHIMRVTQGRPHVQVKLARTRDGYAARLNGPRLMITGPLANAHLHMMRMRADAIMVGIGTVLDDDPLLTVRLPDLEGRSPVRVIVDTHLRLTLGSRLVQGAQQVPVWVITDEQACADKARQLADAGVEVLRVQKEADGRIDLAQALRLLGTKGITRLFCEGGPALAQALATADLIDTLTVTTASLELEEEGLPALGPALQETLHGGRFSRSASIQAGPDQIDHYERIPAPCLPG